MTLPSDAEIAAARAAIDRDGPLAPPTVALGEMVMRNPHLRRWQENVSGPLLSPALIGAMVAGLNYGLRIGEARAGNKPGTPPTKLADLSLHAWIGEDELGSGEIGIKRGRVPSGDDVPLVAISREKMEPLYPQMEAQAHMWGKRIRLCLFRFVEVLRETERGS